MTPQEQLAAWDRAVEKLRQHGEAIREGRSERTIDRRFAKYREAAGEIDAQYLPEHPFRVASGL